MPVSPFLEERKKTLPVSMSVAVIMERRESTNNWVDEVWTAAGVTGEVQCDGAEQAEARVVNEQAGMQQILYPGFKVTLYVDECESYYHNLVSPNPCCYVITRNGDEGIPLPYIVTLSFDVANAYLECEGEVFTVPMQPELYRWMEEFVLQNYVPEKRVKRKRKDWKAAGHEVAGDTQA